MAVTEGDFDSWIVTVQGQVKGRESVRRIPVADLVLDILSELDPTEGRLLAEYSEHEHGNYAKAVARSRSDGPSASNVIQLRVV